MKFLVLLFLLFQRPAYALDFVIIVNPNGPLVKADMEVVRDIYLGETRFIRDIKLKPVNSTEGELKDIFLKRVVGMGLKEYRLHWVKKVFGEGLTIPPSFATTGDIVGFVRREEGAIGYIPKEESSGMEGVTVISPP
ncbi:MAG: hypothetical protein HY883_05215 [Deltaproteobacteria bacterium]|nr:hypothetical protein [Deltaproteobacteria bacterium]